MANTHLYSIYCDWRTKVQWFVRRFGWSELALKPLRTAFAPLIIACLRRRRFRWRGRAFEGFYHPYNITWAGERLVEIPIIRSYFCENKPFRVLEIGNVLSHYFKVDHPIVDKFEQGEGVLNSDILEFRPDECFDLIVSISTFEHIGFDDDASEPSGDKILRAISKCREMLSREGLFVLTVPLGYNPDLDRLITSGDISASRQSFLIRTGFSEWEECSLELAVLHPYRSRFPYANSIGVFEFSKS
jgi:hypothetical protein